MLAESVSSGRYYKDEPEGNLEEPVQEGNENRFDIGNLARVFIVTSIVLSLSSQATLVQTVVIVVLLVLHFALGYRRRGRNVADAGERNVERNVQGNQNGNGGLRGNM